MNVLTVVMFEFTVIAKNAILELILSTLCIGEYGSGMLVNTYIF